MLNRKYPTIFLWAFSCGIPLYLATSFLSIRLTSAGFPLAKIGLLSFTLLPYLIKPFFAGMIENLQRKTNNRPIFKTKNWMLVGFIGVIICIILLSINPLASEHNFQQLFFIALAMTTFSAITDSAEAEYRILLLNTNELISGTGAYNLGYLSGEIGAIAGAMIIASHFGWQTGFLLMAGFMLIGLFTVIKTSYPSVSTSTPPVIKPTWRNSLTAITLIPQWRLLLAIIFLFYSTSFMLALTQNPFFIKLGYPVNQIGSIKLIVGLSTQLFACFLGVILCKKNNPKIILMSALLIYSLVCTFNLMLLKHHSSWVMILPVVITSHIADGISLVAALSFISGLCKQPFIASQYALLTAVVGISRLCFAWFGTLLASTVGYQHFFIIITIAPLPIIWLLGKMRQ